MNNGNVGRLQEFIGFRESFHQKEGHEPIMFDISSPLKSLHKHVDHMAKKVMYKIHKPKSSLSRHFNARHMMALASLA